MKSTLLLLLTAIIFVTCKKEKKEPITPVSQAINTDSIYGEFKIIRDNVFFGDTLKYEQNIIQATFFQQKFSSLDYYLPLNPISVGNVFLNDVRFREETQYIRYFDTSGTLFNPPFHWNIRGNSNFPGFQFTDTPDFPKYSLPLDLPDTLHISKPNVINFGSYYSNSVELFIRGYGSQLHMFEYSPTNTITLHSNDFADNAPDRDTTLFYGPGKIILIFNLENYKILNGKVYKVITSDCITKDCFYLP